ncbi:unnamed protein product [Meloidogyne enterolobii]|uniref:Uncharacterized protein n=1 Tax=Meloidogyne enterolobii TaxID=390850 RepID=A0ACB0ZF14_MELEN
MDEFENELRVAFESGDLEEPVTPSSKRRKSDIVKGLDLGSPKSRRSWNESKIFGSHFDCVIDDKENLTNLVVCKKCNSIFNYAGTHNLRNHIESKHGIQLPAKEKQKMMEDALVEFCVTDARPFSLINGKGFISFLDAYSELIIDRHLKNQTTTSSLILPNEKTISRKVFEVLKSKQPELNSIFNEMSESGFSISLDFSQKLGTDYCVMVAHYITKDWILRHFVLSCLPIPGDISKTRENISDLVNKNLTYLGLDMSKIVFITDEGSNVNHLGGEKHHRCIAHILATISRHITQPYAGDQATDNVIAVESAITDLHSFVSDLRGVLLLPIATRWLSILAMVRAFSAADKESFKEIVNKYSGNQYTERMERIFSKQNFFEAYIQIVSMLEAPLKILEAENKCTMNRLMIEMIKLENAWRGEARGDDLIRAALAKSGLKAFNRKMSEIFIENTESISIIRCAAYLDPAVCGILKKVCQTNCHWGDYETIQKAVRNVAKQNFPECLRPHVENVSPSLVTFGQNAMRTEIDFEMEQYETGCKNLGGHKLDLLKFWKENSMKIPHLSSISKHFLAIPSSSTSCERIFSRFSPLVYDYKRNRFDPHTISTLI